VTETKRARRIETRTPQAKANIAAANRRRIGSKHSAETRARRSESQRGRFVSEESRRRASISNRGLRRSDETKARVKASHWSRHQPEVVEKLKAAHARGSYTDETRRKISEAQKRAWADGRHAVPVPNRYSGLARALHAHLAQSGLTLEPEVRFGRFTVDLYDRVNHVGYEADCRYWHDKYEAKRPGYHVERDAYLLKQFGLPVIRFDERDIRAIGKKAAA